MGERRRFLQDEPLTRPAAVVVGAGAIGVGCAYEPARAGLRVTVIGRAEPGAEASGASAGILSVPDPSRRDHVAALGRLSRDLYEPLAASLSEEAVIDIGLGRTGHLDLCMTEGEVEGRSFLPVAPLLPDRLARR